MNIKKCFITILILILSGLFCNIKNCVACPVSLYIYTNSPYVYVEEDEYAYIYVYVDSGGPVVDWDCSGEGLDISVESESGSQLTLKAKSSTAETYYLTVEAVNSSGQPEGYDYEIITIYVTPANQLPVPGISSEYTQYKAVGQTVNFNGSYSYDPDNGDPPEPCQGITQWWWQCYDSSWNYLGYYSDDEPTMSQPCNTAGHYYIALWVKGDDGEDDWTPAPLEYAAICEVYVIDVEIQAPTSYYVAIGENLLLQCEPLPSSATGGIYHWSVTSGNATFSLNDTTNANVTLFSSTQAGEYTINVTYTLEGASASDTLGTTIKVVKVYNLHFEKAGVAKNWITPCTLAGAHSYAIADITPSGLSITYEIIGDYTGNPHGALIDASSGKIKYDGSNDSGLIRIKAYATACPSASDEEYFSIWEKPVEITYTELQEPYTYIDERSIYGFNKKHTFSSTSGDPSDLNNIQIGEYIHFTKHDFGSLPPDKHPGDFGPGGGTTWFLDETGTMKNWDTHGIDWDGVNINDFWPNNFPAEVSGIQRWYWYSSDGEDWVYISDEPDITFYSSLIKLDTTLDGVTAFKWTETNTSSNPQANCSSESVTYMKGGVEKEPPQYYYGPVLSWDKVLSSDLTMTPSAGSITPGSQLSVTMSGIAGVTETEIASASKLITFCISSICGEEPPIWQTLWNINNENIFSAANGGVPVGAKDGNGNIKGNMVVTFSVTKANALNQKRNGDIIGPEGNSGGTDVGISFSIPRPGIDLYSPISHVTSSAYNLIAPTVLPTMVPLSSNAIVTMSGCTEATVTSGTMNMYFHVIDDDGISDDILVENISHSFAVSSGQILGGLVSFGNKTAHIININGTIEGVAGSSGESTAEIAFEIVQGGSNPQSASTSVTAVQP